MNKLQYADLDKAISDSAKSVQNQQPAENRLNDEECREIENIKRRLLEEEIRDIVDYRDLRNKYANRVFWFMCVWSALTFAVLVTKGFWECFDLNDTVLVTLTGGTTVSVIGLVGFIIQGLFNSNNKRKER